MSKFCTQCGNVMDDSARFCSKCGAVSAPFVRPEAQPEPTPAPAPTPINEQPKTYFTPAVELQAEPVQPTVEQPIEQPVQPEVQPEPIQQAVEPEIQPEPVQPTVEQPIEQPVQQPVQPEPQYQQYQAYQQYQQPAQPQFQQQYQQPVQPQFQQQYQAYQPYQQPVQPQYAQPTTPYTPPKKSKKGLIITIISLVIVAALAVAAYFIVPGLLDKDDDGDDSKSGAKAGSYEAAIEDYLSYTYKANTKKTKTVYHGKIVEALADEEDISVDEAYEKLNGLVEEQLEVFEDHYGEDFKFSFSIIDKEKLDDDDLEDVADFLSEYDIDEKDVTAGYFVDVEIKFEGDKDESEAIHGYTVAEIDGSWYVLNLVGYNG